MCAANISGGNEAQGSTGDLAGDAALHSQTSQTSQAEPASTAIQHTYVQKPRPRNKREARWPIYMAIAAAVVLYVTLQDRFQFGGAVPNWIVPLLVSLLALPLIVIVPKDYGHWPAWRRILGIVITAILSLANLVSLVELVVTLLEHLRGGSADLIFEAMKIWLINVLVFALWYWELDGGGPGRRTRAQGSHEYPDFLFPQYDTPSVAPPEWEPSFVDYLYVSFTNCTAFSPTDTMPITPTAKMLMLVQSIASLVVVALVAARAVNILPTQ